MIEHDHVDASVDRERKVLNTIGTRCRRSVASDNGNIIVPVRSNDQEWAADDGCNRQRLNVVKANGSTAGKHATLVVFGAREESYATVDDQLVARQDANWVTTVDKDWRCTRGYRECVASLSAKYGQGFGTDVVDCLQGTDSHQGTSNGNGFCSHRANHHQLIVSGKKIDIERSNSRSVDNRC